MSRPTLKLKKKPEPAPAPAPVKAEKPTANPKPLSHAERRRRNAAKAAPVLELLAAQYPHLFTPESVKPLCIGFVYDLQRERKAGRLAVTAEPLRAAVAYWVNQSAYYEALAAGGQRYDLDGNPKGEVTEDQRETAAKKLAKAGRK